MLFRRIADVPLKEAKMSEGALKSNYSKASIIQMAWKVCRMEMTDLLASTMSRMTWKDQRITVGDTGDTDKSAGVLGDTPMETMGYFFEVQITIT